MIGRNVKVGVVLRRCGDACLLRTIQTATMQLAIVRVGVAEGRIVHQPRTFVDPLDFVARKIGKLAQLVDRVAAKVTQFKILPTGSFGFPDKRISFVQHEHRGIVVLPSWLSFCHDDARSTCVDVGRHDIQTTLVSIGLVEQ